MRAAGWARGAVLGAVVATAAGLLGAAGAGAQEPTTTTSPDVTVAPSSTTSTSTSTPSERDPSWLASVVLGCGPAPGTKVIETFDAEVPDGSEAQLYLVDVRPDGSGNLTPIGAGAVIADGAVLHWAIEGVLLGPWAVDGIVTTCRMTVASRPTEPPATAPPGTVGATAELPATGGLPLGTLAAAGAILLAIGIPLRRLRS